MWAAVRENLDFLTVVNYTILAAIIDSFIVPFLHHVFLSEQIKMMMMMMMSN